MSQQLPTPIPTHSTLITRSAAAAGRSRLNVRRPALLPPPNPSFAIALEQARTVYSVLRPADRRSHYLPVGSADASLSAGLYRVPRGGSDAGLAAEKPEFLYDALLRGSAEKYGLPFSLVKAVAKAESSFDPQAVSRAGAQGVMQLMPGTARALGVDDPFDPVQNVDAGARYLSEQIQRFGSVELGLAAYNAGPSAVARQGGLPDFDETRAYVARVIKLQGEYEREDAGN